MNLVAEIRETPFAPGYQFFVGKEGVEVLIKDDSFTTLRKFRDMPNALFVLGKDLEAALCTRVAN